jgi:predicted esterase
MTDDPHAGHPVLHLGARPADARLSVILVHGRGGSASDIMGLARELFEEDIAYLAPQAAGGTWYPYSFLAPLDQNEPALSSALGVLDSLVRSLGEEGVPPERIVVIGFSQGACLSLEFTARQARRYAGIAGFSGGLIGPTVSRERYQGTFDGTPVFLGCSDRDPHIPVARVHETAAVFTEMGAVVDERIYPGMGHTINQDELDTVRRWLARR